MDKRNIKRNYLNNSGLQLNKTGYGKLAINFILKTKILSKNLWSFDLFCCSLNNYENVSYKITEFDKEKTRVKEHDSSQFTKSSESSNNVSVFDDIRVNNADRLIIGHLQDCCSIQDGALCDKS